MAPKTLISTLTLAALTAVAAPEDAVRQLASRYLSDREQAVEELLKAAPDAQTALVPAIAGKAVSDNWQTQRAAAEVLQAYGTRAKAAAPALRDATLAALEAGRAPCVELLIETMDAIGSRDFSPVVSKATARLSEPNLLAVTAAVAALDAAGRAAAPAVPALGELLQHEDTERAVMAARVLNAVGPAAKPAVPALVRALGGESRELTRAAAAALGGIGPGAAPAVPGLTSALGSDDAMLAAAAASALGGIGKAAQPALRDLTAALAHENANVADAAADALVGMLPVSVEACIKGLNDPNGRVAARCARVLGEGRVKDAVAPLIEALGHEDGQAVIAAARAMLSIAPEQRGRAITAMCRNISSPDQAVARTAVASLTDLTAEGASEAEQREAVATMVEALGDARGELKKELIVSLGAFGKRAEPAAKLIQEAIWAKQYRGEAVAAMKKIRPGKPVLLEPEIKIDDDLGLDL